jgi:pimeloyl-ACP methyl ester carboxylesterase
VRRVALLGTSGHGMMRRERMKMLDWKGLDDEAERDRCLRHNLGALMLHDHSRIDALALALHRQACLQTRFRSKGYAGRAVLAPALDVLDAHGVPLLLAWGAHDVTATPQETGPALVAGRASRRWQLLPDAGHWLQYEQPAQTEALLEDWFAGVAEDN